jgi:hypothetical protein
MVHPPFFFKLYVMLSSNSKKETCLDLCLATLDSGSGSGIIVIDPQPCHEEMVI